MSQDYQDFFQSHQWTDGYSFIMAPPIPSHGSKECFPEAYFLLNCCLETSDRSFPSFKISLMTSVLQHSLFWLPSFCPFPKAAENGQTPGESFT